MNVHQSSNSTKSLVGNKNKNEVEILCQELKEKNLIQDFTRIPKTGKDYCHVDENGKAYPLPQYHPHFILTDNRGGLILLFTSNSFRSDRFKITMWDSEGLSRHSEISHKVVSTIFVTKDSNNPEDLQEFNAYRKKSGKIYSSIQHLFTESEFINFLRNWETILSDKKIEDEEINDWFKQFDTTGSGNGKRGNHFVSYLCETIQSHDFLIKYSQGVYAKGKLHQQVLHQVFFTCLKDFNIDIASVRSVTSNKNIQYNKTGNPKTDISITLTLTDGSKRRDTFSSKVTKDKSVTVVKRPLN